MVNRCFNWEACGQLQCIGIFSVKCVTQHVLCVSWSCNYDSLILSWLTYYFQSSLLSLLSIVNIQSPSRQNLDVFWDFEFSWRLLLSLSSSSSRRPSSGIHEPITPTHRDPATKQGGRLEGIPCLYRVGRCWWLQGDCLCTDRKWTIKWWGKKLDNRFFTIFHDFD